MIKRKKKKKRNIVGLNLVVLLMSEDLSGKNCNFLGPFLEAF